MNMRLVLLIVIISMLNFSCSTVDESGEDGKSLAKGKIVELVLEYSKLSENILLFTQSDDDDEYEIDETFFDNEQLKEFLDSLNTEDIKYGILI